MTSHNPRSTTGTGDAGEGWGTLFPSPVRACRRDEKHPPQPSPDDLRTCPDQRRRSPADNRHRLAQLRTEWHAARAAGDAERLAEIEDDAARIKALSAVLAVFPDAEVIEDSDTDDQARATPGPAEREEDRQMDTPADGDQPPEPLTPGQDHDRLTTDLAGYGLRPRGSRPPDAAPGDPDPGLTAELAAYGVHRKHTH